MSTFRALLPNLAPYSGQGDQQKLAELQNIVFMLIENLDGALSSLDESNFSPAYKKATLEVKDMANQLFELTGPEGELSKENFAKQFRQLRQAIIDNAVEINQLFNTALEQTQEAISLEAESSYQAIYGDLSLLENTISTLSVRAGSIEMDFEELSTITQDIGDQLTRFETELRTYIHFTSQGIILGEVDSPFTARFGNTKLSFYQSGVEIAYFANNKLWVLEVEAEKLSIKLPGVGYVDLAVEAGGLVGRFREV